LGGTSSGSHVLGEVATVYECFSQSDDVA